MYVHTHILSTPLPAKNLSRSANIQVFTIDKTSRFSLFPNEITFLHLTHFPPHLLSFFPSFLIVKLLQGWLRRGFNSDLVDLCLTGIVNSQ